MCVHLRLIDSTNLILEPVRLPLALAQFFFSRMESMRKFISMEFKFSIEIEAMKIYARLKSMVGSMQKEQQ